MPQISATVRQPVVDRINAQAKQEKRSFSEMVAVLLEKALYEQSGEFDFEPKLETSLLRLERTTATNLRGDNPSDTVQQ